MKQTKLESFIEVCINVMIGFWISYFMWGPVAKLHGIEHDYHQAFTITLIFTVTSILRSYIIRRWFNAGLHKAAISIASKLRSFK